MLQNHCMTRGHVLLPCILIERAKHTHCYGQQNIVSGWQLRVVCGVRAGVCGGAHHAHGEATPSWRQQPSLHGLCSSIC
jgi:hypothetical protein